MTYLTATKYAFALQYSGESQEALARRAINEHVLPNPAQAIKRPTVRKSYHSCVVVYLTPFEADRHISCIPSTPFFSKEVFVTDVLPHVLCYST